MAYLLHDRVSVAKQQIPIGIEIILIIKWFTHKGVSINTSVDRLMKVQGKIVTVSVDRPS